MTGAQIVAQTIELFPENELILASKLYTERLITAPKYANTESFLHHKRKLWQRSQSLIREPL